MSLKYSLKLCFLLCLLVYTLASCDLAPSISINGTPTASPAASTPGDQGTPQLNTWYQGSRGVEVRYEDWKSPGNNEDTVTIVRFDLHYVKLSVAYQPTHPLLVSEWMQQGHAPTLISGGYLDSQEQGTARYV